ncbi:hypothetical protein [Kordiimonas sp.]|uniref:hypothetical protein n=1 Tax=Kordiimonas sp. TaxID=1970157 RepID=UPI003A8D4E72
MGIVTFIVEAADKGLDTVATSQFAAVAEISGTIIMGAATVAIIALFINMAWRNGPHGWAADAGAALQNQLDQGICA